MNHTSRCPALNRLRFAAAAVAAALGVGCGDDVLNGPVPFDRSEVTGVWDFTEVLVVSSQVAVCSDTGSFRFSLDGDSLVGQGQRVGTCQGLLGSYGNGEDLAIRDVSLVDSTITFAIDGGCGCSTTRCADARYEGVVSRGPPRRITGTSACSVNYDGSWLAAPGEPVASLELEPDSAEMVVEETIYLAPVLHDVSGARVFERPLTWSSSNPGVAAVASDGGVVGVGTGTATVTVEAEGLSAGAAVEVGDVALVSVRAGAFHTCGLSAGGSVYCWGANDWGQAGPTPSLFPCPGVPCRRAPARVPEPAPLGSLSLGFLHSCALGSGGTAYCWGSNSTGQLGRDLATVSSPEPLEVAGGNRFAVLSAGANHVCAATTYGEVRCWGLNNRAQLGNNVVSLATAPMPVAAGRSFESVTSGEFHTCALTPAGEPYCWGFNWFGQLGVDSVPGSEVPVPVSGGLALTTLSAGAEHTCGLTASGAAYCWGRGLEGQLGITAVEVATAPVAVSGGLHFASLSSGGRHTCAVTMDGTAYCWGEGSLGRLGDGTENGASSPVPVAGGRIRFSAVSSGFEHTCGITPENMVYCWGSNYDGQIGVAQLAPVLSPTRVVGQR